MPNLPEGYAFGPVWNGELDEDGELVDAEIDNGFDANGQTACFELEEGEETVVDFGVVPTPMDAPVAPPTRPPMTRPPVTRLQLTRPTTTAAPTIPPYKKIGLPAAVAGLYPFRVVLVAISFSLGEAR